MNPRRIYHDTLAFAEAHTRTDMHYLTQGGFWLLLAQAVTVIAGLALSIAFANLLPKEVYGVYRFIISVASIAAAATLPGINTALTRAVAQGNGILFNTLFRERVMWGTLGALATLGTSLYYWVNGNITLSLAFLIVTLFISYSDALNVYEAWRNGKKDFRYLGLADSGTRIAGALIMIGVLWVTENVLWLVAAYFLTYTALRLIFFLDTRRTAQGESSTPTTSASSYIHYGRHLSVQYIISSFVMHIDKIILFHYAGAAAVAAYAFAIVIPDQMRSAIKNIAVLAYPKFVSRNFADIQQALARKNMLLLLCVVILITAYVFIVPFAFPLLFPQYPESILLTQILALSLIETLSLLPLSALKAHEKTSTLYWYNIGTGIMQATLITAGGAFFGLYGVAIAYSVSRGIALSYLYLLFRLHVPQR